MNDKPFAMLRRTFIVAVASLVATFALAPDAGAQGNRATNWVPTWSTSPVGRSATPAVAPAASPAGQTQPAAAASAAPPAATAAAAAGAAPQTGRGAAPAAGAPPAVGRGAVVAPNNQTLRQIVHISLGGDRIRVVVSNSFGTKPLMIGSAQVALRAQNAAIVPGSQKPLTFSGQAAIAVPTGATMVSDPVSLTVPNMADLAIDLFLPEDTGLSMLSRHSVAVQSNYLVPGNQVGAPDLTNATVVRNWYFLARVEVAAPEGTPVIVATGDSITDGTNSTPDTNGRWPDVLARRLLAQRGRRIAVVNAGISGNRLLTEANVDFGMNMLSRLDRDVLIQPGVTHMIFLLGINDIGMAPRGTPGPSVQDLIAGHRQVIARAHALGIKIYGATLTPYEGAAYFSADGEVKREALNQWIRTSKEYDGVIDFDLAMRDPAHPTKFPAALQSGDNLHPNNAGYEVMGNAIDLALFK
jgi:lysophospholipase L1-like esterase